MAERDPKMLAVSDRREAAVLKGTERAVAALRQGIVTGRYVPGQRLVEADLTKELDVGRNSLRESFSRLSSEGLITLEPNRGAYVRRLSRREVGQLYDVSEVLEGLAARLAAEHISEGGQASRLRASIEGLRAAPDSDQVDEAGRFHKVIAEMSGNPRLTELVDQLHVQTFTIHLRHVHPRDLGEMHDDSQEEHVRVADAILRGAGQEAEAEMRDHLQKAKGRFLHLPDDDFA